MYEPIEQAGKDVFKLRAFQEEDYERLQLPESLRETLRKKRRNRQTVREAFRVGDAPKDSGPRTPAGENGTPRIPVTERLKQRQGERWGFEQTRGRAEQNGRVPL